MGGERTLFRVPEWFVVNGEVTVIPDTSMARYLSQPHVLETEHTIGDESNQHLKQPKEEDRKPEIKVPIVHDASKLTVEQLVASVTHR